MAINKYFIAPAGAVREIGSSWKRRGSKGAALVELTIVFPFLFFFFLGAADIGRYISAHLKASAISRDAGNLIFRECRGLDSASTSTCLESRRQLIKQSLNVRVDNWDVRFNVYRCNNFSCNNPIGCLPGSGGNCTCTCSGGMALWGSSQGDPNWSSKYDQAKVEALSIANSANEIMLAETFVKITSISGHLPSTDSYEVQIF